MSTHAVTVSRGKRLAEHPVSFTDFAYLRAIAQGLDRVESARRFLSIQHGHEATALHNAVVERVKALARRKGDSRWRLVGLALPPPPPSSPVPTVDAWAAAEGLDDWSWEDQVAMHAERFGPAAGPDRRARRNERLQERRLALLRDLEASAAQPAQPSDLLDGWLPPRLVEVLRRHGDLTLADLQRRIAVGGRWWSILPAFGPIKARRLSGHVDELLRAHVGLKPSVWPVVEARRRVAELVREGAPNRAPGQQCVLGARCDIDALHECIAAKAGSVKTAALYERESDRFLYWAALLHGKSLGDITVHDCRAYVDWLESIPPGWISRRKVERLAPGWAPFRGQLSVASRQIAITVLHSMFAFLMANGYLHRNPWSALNRRLGDDPKRSFSDPTSKAFTPAAWQALVDSAGEGAEPASAARLRWVLAWTECAGLRASELIAARRGQIGRSKRGWFIDVDGKGRRKRRVMLPSTAIKVTRAYFAHRGLAFDECDADTPLLASLTDPTEPVSYAALYQTFKRLVMRAARRLPPDEREALRRASTHWLRHTSATRMVELELPPDVVQEQLGHADPRTTAAYYRAQEERRARLIEEAWLRRKAEAT